MPSRDPFYNSPAWRATSKATLVRDGHKCRAPGCTATATSAHHYPRRVVLMAQGISPLDMRYTYSLCVQCHGRADAQADGSIVAVPHKRRSKGMPRVNRFLDTVGGVHRRD